MLLILYNRVVNFRCSDLAKVLGAQGCGMDGGEVMVRPIEIMGSDNVQENDGASAGCAISRLS